MKNKLMLVIACFCVAGFVQGATVQLLWGNLDGHIYDNTGVDQAATADWLFQVVIDRGTVTDVASMIANDTLQIGVGASYGADTDVTIDLQNSNWNPAHPDLGQAGVGGPNSLYSDYDGATYGGSTVFIRFFNAATEGAATFGGLIYNDGTTPWSLPADSAPANAAYISRIGGDAGTLGTTHAGGADGWAATIAVPEPASFALFALGMLTMGARSLRRRK